MKTCKACGLNLPLSSFSKHTGKVLRTICKVCRSELAKARYSEMEKTSLMEASRLYKERRRLTHRAHYLITAARQRSKTKNIPFDLNMHQLEIQERLNRGLCEMTGIKFDMQSKQTWNSPSLDRIVPANGYIKSNIRIILFSLNVMMHNWGLEPVLAVSKALTKE